MRTFRDINDHLSNRESWRKDAACATSPLAPWYTADVVPVEIRRELRALCEQCPVKGHCLVAALSPQRATAGYWAGRSFNQWGGSRD